MRKNMEDIQIIVGVLDKTKEDMIDIAGNILNMKEILEQYMEYLMRKREHLKSI